MFGLSFVGYGFEQGWSEAFEERVILYVDLSLLLGGKCLDDWSHFESAKLVLWDKYFEKNILVGIIADDRAGLLHFTGLKGGEVHFVMR